MNAAVVHKTNKTGEIKNASAMYVKQNGCAKPDVVIYISGENNKAESRNPEQFKSRKRDFCRQCCSLF